MGLEMAGDAHDDEGVGQLVAGVLQPRVVCVERMSQSLLICSWLPPKFSSGYLELTSFIW